MRKIIVFRVENVLVKDYDEMGMWELRMKKWVREMVKKECGVDMNDEKDLEGMKKKVEELERMYGDIGDLEMMIGMRNVGKRIRGVEEDREKMMEEMRRKFIDDSFEKRKIVVREDLMDLERVGRIVDGMRMIYVSGLGKMRVCRLLLNNGLKDFEVLERVEEIGEVDKGDVVMFGDERDLERLNEMDMRCVVGVKDLWKEIGLKKVG